MAILPHKDVSNLRQNETKFLGYGRGFPIIIRILVHHKIIIINENYRNIPNLTNFGQIMTKNLPKIGGILRIPIIFIDYDYFMMC
jgi:hypothetical protein